MIRSAYPFSESINIKIIYLASHIAMWCGILKIESMYLAVITDSFDGVR